MGQTTGGQVNSIWDQVLTGPVEGLRPPPPDPVPPSVDSFPSVLDALNEVVCIYPDEDGFVVEEQCDNHFSVTLTREQLLTLAQELIELAK